MIMMSSSIACFFIIRFIAPIAPSFSSSVRVFSTVRTSRVSCFVDIHFLNCGANRSFVDMYILSTAASIFSCT